PEMPVEQRSEFILIIVKESERLTRMINQVLDLSKLESGSAEWHPTELDLGEVIQDAVSTTSGLARERGVTVEEVLPAELPRLPRGPTPDHAGAAQPHFDRREVLPARGRAHRRRGRRAARRAAGRRDRQR